MGVGSFGKVNKHRWRREESKEERKKTVLKIYNHRRDKEGNVASITPNSASNPRDLKAMLQAHSVIALFRDGWQLFNSFGCGDWFMRGHLDGASTKLASVTSKLSIPTKPPTTAASANLKMIGLG